MRSEKRWERRKNFLRDVYKRQMDDTPLGRVVAVRSERDRKMLEKFTPQQRKMRSEWSAFRARKAAKAFTGEQLRRQMDDLEQMMAKAFGS